VSGEFFDSPDGSDFIENFHIFDKNIQSGRYQPKEIQKIAEKYDRKVFEEEIRKVVGL